MQDPRPDLRVFGTSDLHLGPPRGDDGMQHATDAAGARRTHRLALVAGAGAVAMVASAAFLWVTTPDPEIIVGEDAAAFLPRAGAAGLPGASPPGGVAGSWIVVDVEGAVARPGVQRIAAGSRVGDAIAAAGGFSARVDALRAARELNLAQPLNDGQKVNVPELGSAAQPDAPDAAASGAPGDSALIDINHASASELEALPGIGSVTAARILEARAQAPFTTADELRERGLVGESTWEKIRESVTALP